MKIMENIRQRAESSAQDSQTPSRRDFLARAALAGAGFAIGASVWAAQGEQPLASNERNASAIGGGKHQ